MHIRYGMRSSITKERRKPMKCRIRKKISKRHGYKSWNRYWDYCAGEEISKRTKGHDIASNNGIYIVVSRKRRKRKILKLLVLKNCIPVSINQGCDTTANSMCVGAMHVPHAVSRDITDAMIDDMIDDIIASSKAIKFKPYKIDFSDEESTVSRMLHSWLAGIDATSPMHPQIKLPPVNPEKQDMPKTATEIERENWRPIAERIMRVKDEKYRELVRDNGMMDQPYDPFQFHTNLEIIPGTTAGLDRVYVHHKPTFLQDIKATVEFPPMSPAFKHVLEYFGKEDNQEKK